MDLRRLLVQRSGSLLEVRRRLAYGTPRLVVRNDIAIPAPRTSGEGQTPAGRMVGGHHPSCPARTSAGAACTGCGSHLSVVA